MVYSLGCRVICGVPQSGTRENAEEADDSRRRKLDQHLSPKVTPTYLQCGSQTIFSLKRVCEYMSVSRIKSVIIAEALKCSCEYQ